MGGGCYAERAWGEPCIDFMKVCFKKSSKLLKFSYM